MAKGDRRDAGRRETGRACGDRDQRQSDFYRRWESRTICVEHVVDINSRKQGTFLPGTGQQIVSPDTLIDYRPDVVIVMNPIYQEEVRRDLELRGLGSQIIAL